MMNKKKQLHYNLNTINIGYKKERKYSKDIYEEKQKDSRHNQYFRQQLINTIQDCKVDPQDSLDVQFNDNKIMEYGKSQTMKQSQFNRIRVNIYQRDKQYKWSDLSVHHHSSLQKDIKTYQPAQSQLTQRKKQLKTVMVRRRLVQPSVSNTKLKVRSTQRKQNSKSRSESADHMNKIMMQNGQFSLRSKQQSKQNSPQKDKLSKLLDQIKIKAQKHKDISSKLKQKKSNAPDQTNIRKRLAKLQMRRFVMPFRFRQPKKVIHHQVVKEIPGEESARQQFKAWQYVDAFNSSKHGIEQYTIQQSIKPQGKTDSPKRQTTSRKKKVKNVQNHKN